MRGNRLLNWGATLMLAMPLAAPTAYCLHAVIWGAEGYFVLEERRAEVAARERHLQQVQAERVRLEERVRQLRTDTLDLDLLNERARVVLGYARPDEHILLIPEAD